MSDIPPIERIDEFRIRIPRQGAMRTEGLVFLDDSLLAGADQGLTQVANVACLPGIVGPAMAMPDIHWGYGFPIGGVAAFDPAEGGIVSPGGVGYDINCGVRLHATNLTADEIQPKLSKILTAVFAEVPAGVGSQRADLRLSKRELERVLEKGAAWAVDHGFGTTSDLEAIEDGGVMPADPQAPSQRAKERGKPQLGTLGSGNHFVEIGRVSEIFDKDTAAAFGLQEGMVTFMVHSGSRGLGYQVCDDSIRTMLKASRKYGIEPPDRQLSGAPVNSPEGRRYLETMGAAANFAFANRQIMGALVERAIQRALHVGPSDLGARLVYDVCHNIAKLETHRTDQGPKTLCVHRKGATRSLGPGDEQLSRRYRDSGQPVLVPGDMGTESYVLAGTKQAATESFSSCCHGAGRVLSRRGAVKAARGRSIFEELGQRGVLVQAASARTVAEELPEAYKDVSQVVSVAVGAGLAKLVAKLTPLAVVKG